MAVDSTDIDVGRMGGQMGDERLGSQGVPVPPRVARRLCVRPGDRCDMSFETLPDGWTVWHQESGGRAILAYRPDVFDTEAFPAPCLPTIYLSPGSPRRRPGARQSDGWTVTLYLEPEVDARVEGVDTRETAVETALELARAFAAGDVDYRAAYQVPREAYFDRLDELVGSDES